MVIIVLLTTPLTVADGVLIRKRAMVTLLAMPAKMTGSPGSATATTCSKSNQYYPVVMLRYSRVWWPLFLAALISPWSSHGAQQPDKRYYDSYWPGPCATANHKVHFGGFGILHFATRAEVPILHDLENVIVPSAPLRYEVTVGPSGAPCMVRFIDSGVDPRLVAKVQDVIALWHFRTDKGNGQTYCLSSKVLVYVRQGPGGLTLVVPGISDNNPQIDSSIAQHRMK